jgi:hypothetical protein
MNSFDFLKKIGPQTIFIGGWGKKFNFLDFFQKFWTSSDQTTIKYKFK